MLPAIKSLLAGFTPASAQPIQPVPASHSDPVKAQVVKKHREMFQGKTAVQVSRLTTELAEAHRALEHARHTLGERIGEEMDTSMALDELTRAESRVKALDAALQVARQKDDEAQRALTDAKREAEIEIDDALVEVLKAAALKMEALMSGEMKLRADELTAALMAVKDRCGSDTGVASSLTDLLAWFSVYRDRACGSLIQRGRQYSRVIDVEQKTFSAWADGVAYAVAHRRKGQ